MCQGCCNMQPPKPSVEKVKSKGGSGGIEIRVKRDDNKK